MMDVEYCIIFHIIVYGDHSTMSNFYEDISWTPQFYPYGPDSGIVKFLDTKEMFYDIHTQDKRIVLDRLNDLVKKYPQDFFVDIFGTITPLDDQYESSSIVYKNGEIREDLDGNTIYYHHN